LVIQKFFTKSLPCGPCPLNRLAFIGHERWLCLFLAHFTILMCSPVLLGNVNLVASSHFSSFKHPLTITVWRALNVLYDIHRHKVFFTHCIKAANEHPAIISQSRFSGRHSQQKADIRMLCFTSYRKCTYHASCPLYQLCQTQNGQKLSRSRECAYLLPL